MLANVSAVLSWPVRRIFSRGRTEELSESVRLRLSGLVEVALDWADLAMMPRQGLVDLGIERPETVGAHIGHVRDIASDIGRLEGFSAKDLRRLDNMIRWHEMPEVIIGDRPLVPREDRTAWQQINWQREVWIPETREQWEEKRACIYRDEVVPTLERLLVRYHPDDAKIIWEAIECWYLGRDKVSVLGQETHLVQPAIIAVRIASKQWRFPAEDFVRRSMIVENPRLRYTVEDLNKRLKHIRARS